MSGEEPQPGIDPNVLRAVMASFPTGVTIVTAALDGTLCGMAANSFTSVSLEPPIVLVCCQRQARTARAAKRSGRFAIHILRYDQVDVARAFVGHDGRRFETVPYDLDPAGLPLLREWLALIVCDTYSVVVAGDHEVLFGEVTHCERREASPLLFHERALRRMPRLPPLRATVGEVPTSAEDEDLYDSLVRVLAPPIRRDADAHADGA